MINRLYKWIQIIEIPEMKKPEMKTDAFLVRSHVYDVNLGWIKWIPSWRKYGFCPEPTTFYEEDCLTNIVEFLEELKKIRKEQKEKAK